MKRKIIFIILTAFGLNGLMAPSYGQETSLPEPGRMVMLSAPYAPPVIRGMKLDAHNPFKFDFIIDQGDTRLDPAQMKETSRSLVGYFLASLTTPEKEIWVNLSPYERQRIIPLAFSQTQMGQELLGEDYLLKQIMATALYPENTLGKKFWTKVYAQTKQEFGTTNIAINTFNKVWIVPDQAVVYENARMNTVFVVDSSLKVMLDQDYWAAHEHKTSNTSAANVSSQIIKEIIIPALEKEVNEGKNFAPLRQVYQSLILAKWYKDHLKQSVLGKGYVDRDKIGEITGYDRNLKEKIYDQYLKAYRKGVFNFIKEDIDAAKKIPRKYFSGGIMGIVNEQPATKAQQRTFSKRILQSLGLILVAVNLLPNGAAPQTIKVKAHQNRPIPTLASKITSHKKDRKKSSKTKNKARDEEKKNWILPEGPSWNIPRNFTEDSPEAVSLLIQQELQSFPANVIYEDFLIGRIMAHGRYFDKHLGIDILVPYGTPIFAPFEGMVEELNQKKLAGNMVKLSVKLGPGKRLVFKFEHMSVCNTSVNGKLIPIGGLLGFSGKSGNALSMPAQVHLGVEIEVDVFENDVKKTLHYVLDPYPYLVDSRTKLTPEAVLNNSLEEGYNRYARLKKYFPDAHSFISFTQALMNSQNQPKPGKKAKSKKVSKPDFWDIPGASHIDQQIWEKMVAKMMADGYLSPDEDWTIPTLQRHALIEAAYIDTLLENLDKTSGEVTDSSTILKQLVAHYLNVPDADPRALLILENYQRAIAANSVSTLKPTGGIDLRKTSVRIQPGSGPIVTAFDDPGQLKMLLRSTGITAVIVSMTPATAAMINTLLF